MTVKNSETRTRTSKRQPTTRRSTSTQLTKDEIRDLLALTQKKLADSEKALEAMAEQVAALEQDKEQQQSLLAGAKDEALETRVDFVLTRRELEVSQNAARRYQDELMQMTNLLVAAMNEKEAASNAMAAAKAEAEAARKSQAIAAEAISAAEVGVKNSEKELGRLKEKSAEKISRLEQELAQKQDKIDEQVRELATSAALLQQAEARNDLYLRSYKSALHWMSGVGSLITAAEGEEQPSDEVLVQYSELLARRGAFNGDWYAATYGDVANGGMHPGLHFLKYGVLEGRHPTDILPLEAPADLDDAAEAD